MRMAIYISVIFLMGVVMTGCASTKTTTIDVNTAKVVYTKIPEQLLTPCVPDKPIAPETYLTFQPHEREEYLTDYSVKLMGTLRDCNSKLKKIEALNTRTN